MPFQKKFRVPFVAVSAPVEPFEVFRDKEAGTVTAVIRGGAVTTQKADSAARGMFTVPVRLARRERVGDVETRHYVAQGWTA